MIILSAKDLTMSFGSRVLFKDVCFEIDERAKAGLVGANGTGKSTLFKLITGELSDDGGEIVKSQKARIGYMEQQACRNDENTVYGEVLTVFSELMKIENELNNIALSIEMNEGDIDSLISRQMVLNDKFERDGGLTYRSRGRSALLGLGFSENELDMKIGELSGGQRSKVSLAKLLVSDSNLLLLDEPTNHLDVEAINWLENFLGEYKGAYIVISHDRYFLDKVTNMTMELEHQTLTQYDGNYSKYLDEKERRRQEAEHRYESQMHEINRIEGIIEQQRRWNREKNIRTAESKQKMVDRLKEQLEKPEKEERGIRFEFGVNTRGGNDVLFCDRLSKSFDEKQLFKNVNIHIQNGERVFLLGANGCGKTTLFKIIDGDIFADSGKVTLGSRIETGYYDQTQANLNPAKTALDEVWDSYRDMTETAVRNALAAFLFRGDDVYKKIAGLSGGERARIALLKLMLSRANFLLLDEPTNHLDIKSREALEAALESYRGTLFIISHDRYFINKTADRILYLDSTGITEFKGGYSYYLEHLERLNHDSVEKKPEKPVVNEFKLKKERQSEIRRTRTAVSKCESRISELDGEVEELERRLQIPEIMSDYAKILELTGRLDELKNEQTQVLEDWEKLSERLVELEAAEV